MEHGTQQPDPPNTPTRDLLTAVLDALDIPAPATVGDTEVHDRLLAERVMHAKVALRGALEDGPLGIDWVTGYLREQLTKCPATGYVTTDQAQAALTAGKTWTEAINPTVEDTPMPESTPIQIHADRIVTLAAGHLAEQATTPHPIDGHPTDRCMNQNLLDDAIRRAQEAVLPTVRPYASHDLVRAAVRALLLPVAGTVGEYADRLRAMAVSG